jgi:O-antigen/teichoic acid export membrane protein
VLAVVGALVPSQAPLIAVAVAVPFAMYGQATNGILLAADRVSATNVKALITGSVLNAVLIALLVLLHVDAWIVIWAWVASYVAAAGYTWFALRPFVREGGPPPGEIIREQAIFGLKAGGGQVAAYINLRIDVILVSAVLGARALGLYTLAVTVSELLWQLSQPVCWSAFGRIATAPRDESAAFAAKLVRHIVAIVLPVAAVLFIVGPVAIAIVYGAPFADSGGALRWILPGVAAYAAEIPIGYYLLVKEARPVLVVGCQTVSLLACAALTLITLPRWGIDGAAFATSATYIGVVVVQAAVFIRTTGIPVRDLLILRRDDFGRLSGLFARMRARAGALVAR